MRFGFESVWCLCQIMVCTRCALETAHFGLSSQAHIESRLYNLICWQIKLYNLLGSAKNAGVFSSLYSLRQTHFNAIFLLVEFFCAKMFVEFDRLNARLVRPGLLFMSSAVPVSAPFLSSGVSVSRPRDRGTDFASVAARSQAKRRSKDPTHHEIAP
jgi:hypothetical protein